MFADGFFPHESCYTFGSSETIESYYALATGGTFCPCGSFVSLFCFVELPVLSQQFLLDCTNNSEHCGGTGGCGGGTARQVVETVIKLGGIPQEYTYPYMSYFGVAQTCVNDPSKQSKVTRLSFSVFCQSFFFFFFFFRF